MVDLLYGVVCDDYYSNNRARNAQSVYLYEILDNSALNNRTSAVLCLALVMQK
jgi:hypothetical protein